MNDDLYIATLYLYTMYYVSVHAANLGDLWSPRVKKRVTSIFFLPPFVMLCH
jgi:hypothetical protein